MSSIFRNRLRFTLLAMLFTGPIVLALGIYDYLQDSQIIARGQTTMGTVSSEYIDPNRSTSPSRYLVVDYNVSGTNYRNNFEVGANKYSQHPKGSQIAVHYLPSDPNSAMLGRSFVRSAALIMIGIVMFIVSVGYRLHQARQKAASG